MIPLRLASASPRRRDLLESLGQFELSVEPADVSEVAGIRENPKEYVLRLAQQKASAVHRKGMITLGADTVVCIQNRILEKPSNADEARSFLQLLQDAEHQVLTGICLLGAGSEDNSLSVSEVAATTVSFRPISKVEMEKYLASGEWKDKAGGYGIQGRAAVFCQALHGEYSNVVGLPLCRFSQCLAKIQEKDTNASLEYQP